MEKEIDKLGRIVLPISFRRSLGIKAHDKVSINLIGATITIVALDNKCALCGNNIQHVKDLKLCKACIDRVKSYK